MADRLFFRCVLGFHRRPHWLAPCERCGEPFRAVYHVRSAESRNAGADIPGASEDAARIAKRLRGVLAKSKHPGGVIEVPCEMCRHDIAELKRRWAELPCGQPPSPARLSGRSGDVA